MIATALQWPQERIGMSRVRRKMSTAATACKGDAEEVEVLSGPRGCCTEASVWYASARISGVYLPHRERELGKVRRVLREPNDGG